MTIRFSYKLMTGEQIGEYNAERQLGIEGLKAAQAYATECLIRERAQRTTFFYPSAVGGRTVKITAAIFHG